MIASLFMAALATAAPRPEPQGGSEGGWYLYDTFAEEEPDPQQVYFYKQLSVKTQYAQIPSFDIY
jgi:hypothetical protein